MVKHVCPGPKAGVGILQQVSEITSPGSRREGAAGTDIAQSPAKGKRRGISLVEFCFCLMLLGSQVWLLIHQKGCWLQSGGGRAGALPQ